jgi:uncharacterized membrane protein
MKKTSMVTLIVAILHSILFSLLSTVSITVGATFTTVLGILGYAATFVSLAIMIASMIVLYIDDNYGLEEDDNEQEPIEADDSMDN